jgi:uncharacterized protein YgbK (DUF1537 family)
MKSGELLLAFYGDDFTGSTDALESLSRAGAKTVLFLEPPKPEQMARYSGLQAIGVAGMTRSMATEEMEQELRPAFAALRALGAAHVHYKVCSTFDSSTTIGSIGKAIDVGAETFPAAFIPLLVAAPALGRYCVFGNLFARTGMGSNGSIYRLDRHPAMSRHPVTPADESDLRVHLSRQTQRETGLMDILHVSLSEAEAQRALADIIRSGAGVVLFDALSDEHIASIGRLIDAYAGPHKTLFSVGSSGIETALGSCWKELGYLQPEQRWPEPGKVEPLLVASGSCSPDTAGQITWALSHGFAEVALDTEAVARAESPSILDEYAVTVTSLLNQGRNVILHTSRGANDQRVQQTTGLFKGQGLDKRRLWTETARLCGVTLGRIIKTVARHTSVKRLVIAGGDTSSFAARELGIAAVEMIAPLSPGAPLCRAYAPRSPCDGMEINFKGGQVGPQDYFGMVLEGRSVSSQAERSCQDSSQRTGALAGGHEKL